MAVKLGNGKWAVKENNLLAYNDNSGQFFNKEFDFTRGSSATYVGKDGLIKTAGLQDTNLVQNGDFSELGSELVTNGDFATDSDWSKQAGWTITDGTANFVEAGGNRNIYQTILTVGKTYKLTYTVSNYVSGGVRNISGPYVTRTANGTYTEIIKTTTYDRLFPNCLAGSQLSIDNVSVKEVRAEEVEAVKCLADAIHRIGIQDIQN